VFVTHAHADHFGGLAYLQRRLDIPAYAPALEDALMANPIIEPIYLFSGAAPIHELRHKFTLAQPCRIDQVVEPGIQEIAGFDVEIVHLAGHSPNQMGLAINSTLFCADAVFPEETLQKHKVPFCVDLDQMLDSLEKLQNMPYAHFLPGHGALYNGEKEIKTACAANRQRLAEIRDTVLEAIREPKETSALVQHIARHLELHLTTATSYFLTRTTVLAALSSLEQTGQAIAQVLDNRVVWQEA
jgi:glyoxylase-like metal-dependent hydrolase (beta-lactamase superfamily II)